MHNMSCLQTAHSDIQHALNLPEQPCEVHLCLYVKTWEISVLTIGQSLTEVT